MLTIFLSKSEVVSGCCLLLLSELSCECSGMCPPKAGLRGDAASFTVLDNSLLCKGNSALLYLVSVLLTLPERE